MTVQIVSNNSSKFSEFILKNMVDDSKNSNVTAFNNRLFETIADVCGEALKNCSLSLSPGIQHCSFLGSKDIDFEFEIKKYGCRDMSILRRDGRNNVLFFLAQSDLRSHYWVSDWTGGRMKRPVDTILQINEDKIKVWQDNADTVEKIEDQAKILNHFKTSLTDFINLIAPQQKVDAQAKVDVNQASSTKNTDQAKPDSGQSKPDPMVSVPSTGMGFQFGLLAGVGAIGVALGFAYGNSKQKNESVKASESDTQKPKQTRINSEA